LIDRIMIEKAEVKQLAAYAAHAAKSRGRVYPQDEHPLRTAFQRDRDRIIHSTAFRRLDFKTQVFIPHEGDHFRTRLTHTLEVAQISRSMSRNLGLNEDLAEAIALAHDLGHTPFGHSGEDVLDELLQNDGGFNHNRQSLRVIDLLEQSYRRHPGLNLSYEVREGIAKHETKTPMVHPDFEANERPTLEASLVDIADEIAYNAHDIDDGLRSGLIKMDALHSLKIFSNILRQTQSDDSSDKQRHSLVRRLIGFQVENVLTETERQISRLSIINSSSVRMSKEAVCRFSGDVSISVKELKRFLSENLYHHPQLTAKTKHSRAIIDKLFNLLKSSPQMMPLRFQEMLKQESENIVIADYIAGMTDRYAEQICLESG